MTRLAGALLCALLLACERPVPKSPPFAFDAATPTAADFATEATLLERWQGPLRAHWDSGVAGTFEGVGGVPVAYRVHRVPGAKAAIVITPGRTEAIIKYAEVVADLNAQGYTTWALTLRGQGEAGRMLADREKGYVDWFDDYVTDTHTFISTVVRAEWDGPVFSLAHSLSGAVLATVNDSYPGDLDALVLSAPMLDINLGAFPPPVAATLASGVCNSTDGTGWAVGSGPYQREEDFAKNTVSHSEARWTWKVSQLDDDASLRLGGVTWRWLCQALAGSSRAQALGARSGTPTLLLQAEEDSFVNPAGQDRYCEAAPRCTQVRLPGARHEVLQESDAVRNDALARIVKFFNAQVTP